MSLIRWLAHFGNLICHVTRIGFRILFGQLVFFIAFTSRALIRGRMINSYDVGFIPNTIILILLLLNRRFEAGLALRKMIFQDVLAVEALVAVLTCKGSIIREEE